MTQVTLERDGSVFTVRAEGHATGSVEVCAAVSCLLYTLAAWLTAHEDIPSTVRLEDADATVVMIGSACETAFEMLCAGFLSLQKTAPEYVAVEMT